MMITINAWYILGICLGISSLSLGITLTLLNRRVKTLREFVKNGLEAFTDDLEEQLKPILETNSRAMSIIGTQGAEVKKFKAAERMLSQGLLEDNKLVIDGLRAVFPRLGEYIDENPEVGIELLPRIQKIISNYQETTSPYQSRSHPFRNLEE